VNPIYENYFQAILDIHISCILVARKRLTVKIRAIKLDPLRITIRNMFPAGIFTLGTGGGGGFPGKLRENII
jgi:hypothetical protein